VGICKTPADPDLGAGRAVWEKAPADSGNTDNRLLAGRLHFILLIIARADFIPLVSLGKGSHFLLGRGRAWIEGTQHEHGQNHACAK